MAGRRPRAVPPLPRRAPDADPRANVGEMLAEIVAGTASTGEAFFESLVLCLSRALHVRWAMLGELVGPESVRTLGFAADGALQPATEYGLPGTPCANVIAGDVCYYPERVHELFPADAMLREIGARSYLGVPLRSSREEPLGILLVMHDSPLEKEVDPAVILRIFAARAAAEIERLQHERERVRQDERIRESEALFTKMFRSSPALAVIARPEGAGIVDVNDAVLEAWGLRRDEIVGRTAVDLGIWTAEQRDALTARLARDGRVASEVVEIETQRGRRSALLFAEQVDIAGEPFILVMAHDFTDYMRAERALRRSEERWRRLSEAAFEGISLSRDGQITDANERLAQMFGYTVPEMIGRSVLDFAAPESMEEVRRNVAAGSVLPYEGLGLRRDGSLMPLEIRGRDFMDGERPGRVTVMRDMTERKRLEAELRAAVREWNECFDAMPAGLLIADEAGGIRRANRRILEWAGKTEFRELVGRRIDAAAAGEPWARLMRIALSRPVAVPSDEVEDAAGKSWRMAWSVFPRKEGEAPWTILVLRDVTEEATLRDHLRRQETLAAMGSLVAGVAHEVRTPLFSISATLDAFDGGTPEEMAEGRDLLRAQVKRLSALMSDLLDYGRPPGLQLVAGAVEDVVERAVRASTLLAAESGVAVETELARWLPAVRLDRGRLEQAFQNLITNAIQHAPRGSRVRVVVSAAGPRVLCRIEDTGPGIDEESLGRVFEPFFTRRKGGTGLGLPIVQRIVEAHGGTVAAANRAGGGAVFTLSLPAAPETLPREAGHA